MCNPRRIRVRATRELALAWEEEVRRTVVRRGEVVGEARITESLRGTVGAPTLAALPRAFAGSPGWRETDEGYRHPVGGGYVLYRPDTAELEIVATASAVVESVGEASRAVSGEVRDTFEAQGEGVWYDDEPGLTQARARRQAQADAELRLRQAGERRIREEVERAGERLAAELDAAAGSAADAAYARATAEREARLRSDAATRLAAVGVAARNLFHEVLAVAYRDALLAFARSRGAEGIRCSERDGVLEIEFELDV
ncbi:hypothetical protein GCM10009639_24350 [Kitasatospora putterlickiae]|uniref:FtsH ternary system domain-containing protein n=1 Tax=Kitasatospora putterlickiae TaxID=221725 RepID=A0ABP4IKB1_9ACTN